jgi:predicted RNase H-like HicB family nuclease
MRELDLVVLTHAIAAHGLELACYHGPIGQHRGGSHMLTAYIQAAMRRATYEILEDNEGFYGKMPGLQGVWGNATTLEGCREDLQETLEGWLLLGLRLGHTIPPVDGVDLMAPLQREAA